MPKFKKHDNVYAQLGPLKEYKITKTDERIIRRYVLLLSDTAPVDYLINVMAYVFRTTVCEVKRIVGEASGRELCEVAMIRERWRKNREKGLGYISKKILE